MRLLMGMLSVVASVLVLAVSIDAYITSDPVCARLCGVAVRGKS